MVNGLHIHILNRTMKPFAIVLVGQRGGLRRRDSRVDVTNVNVTYSELSQ
jgi:hypothetical protein